MRKKAREIFMDKPKPYLAAQRELKQQRKRVRDKGRGSRNQKDNGKPFIQKTLRRSIYKEIERESLHTHQTESERE